LLQGENAPVSRKESSVTRTDPVPPPEQPTTEAGRDVQRKIERNTIGPDDEEIYLEDILAIEAEARAAERRAVVERLPAAIKNHYDGGGETLGNAYDDADALIALMGLDAVATDTPEEPER
jgi:primase-polymerase (primpol)-like protein